MSRRWPPPASACSPWPRSAEARPTPSAQDAAAALRAGDYDAAIAALTRQARLDPRRAAVHRALARTLAEVGRYADAEAAIKAFQAANPRSPELQGTLGEVLVARGRRARGGGRLQEGHRRGRLRRAHGGGEPRRSCASSAASATRPRGASAASSTPTTRATSSRPRSSSRWPPPAATSAPTIRSSSRTRSRPSTRPSPPIPTTSMPASA